MMILFVFLVGICLAIVDVKASIEEDSLILHNRLRARHGVPDLKLSSSLCEECHAHAAIIAKSQSLEHSAEDGNYTENIDAVLGNPLKTIQKWYDEIQRFNFRMPSYSDQTSHFTAMIWKSSEWFGYGQADDSNGKTYIVARYTPAGNLEGHFRENVRKVKKILRNKGICLFVNFHILAIAQLIILLLSK